MSDRMADSVFKLGAFVMNAEAELTELFGGFAPRELILGSTLMRVVMTCTLHPEWAAALAEIGRVRGNDAATEAEAADALIRAVPVAFDYDLPEDLKKDA